jgi:hypothetical protein
MEQEIAFDGALKGSSTKKPEAEIALQRHNNSLDGDQTRQLLSNAIAKYYQSIVTAQMGDSGGMNSKIQRKNSPTTTNQAQQQSAGQPNRNERRDEKTNPTIDLCSLEDENSSAGAKNDKKKPPSARNVSDSVLRQHEEAWAAHNRSAAHAVEDQLQWRLAALRHNQECYQNSDNRFAQVSTQSVDAIPSNGAELLLDSYVRSYQRWVQESAAAITNGTRTSFQEELAQVTKTGVLPEAAPPAKRTLSLPQRPTTDGVVVADPRVSLPVVENDKKDKETNRTVDCAKRKREDSDFLKEHWEHFPSASATFGDKKGVDTPITYLVRQLLGQIPVLGNEPPLVLDAKLIQDLSSKIRLVVDRIIDRAVEKALTKSGGQDVPDVTDMVNDIKAKAQVMNELTENLRRKTNDIKSLRESLEKKANDYQVTFQALDNLKTFTQKQSEKVHEQNQLILKLRQQLEERTHVNSEQEFAQIGQLAAHPDSGLIQSLVQQLQGGVSKVQLQNRQIAALRDEIRTDKASLKAKDETIRQLEEKLASKEQSVKAMREQVEKIRARPSVEEFVLEKEDEIKLLKHEIKRLKETLVSCRQRATTNEATGFYEKDKELAHLRREVKELQESLRAERKDAETKIRAYMRASVHALKKHRADNGSAAMH